MAELRELKVKLPIKFSEKAQKDLYKTCMAYKKLAEVRGAENDKLRELVADMWICISHGSEGWDCTGCRRDPDVVCIRGISEFSQRMGELGIEVE